MLQPITGQHVLLTGANGFVASHILSILIDVSISLKWETSPSTHMPAAWVYHYRDRAVSGQGRRGPQNPPGVEDPYQIRYRIRFHIERAFRRDISTCREAIRLRHSYGVSGEFPSQRHPERDD